MELKKPAVAGSLESSDAQITVRPNPECGVEIHIRSDVMTAFGKAIEKVVRDTLDEFGVKDAVVDVQDKGALDFTLKSRMQCAVLRAAGEKFDWTKENRNA